MCANFRNIDLSGLNLGANAVFLVAGRIFLTFGAFFGG